MKKFFTALILIFIYASVSYGAASGDIYVRQDVFDAKMEALFNRIHAEIVGLRQELKNDISELRQELKSDINELRGDIKALSARVDGVDKRIDGLDKRIDSVDKRIDGTNTFLYYLLVLLGILVAIPSVSKWLDSRREMKSAITIDDVKRLIEENNFQLQQKFFKGN